MRKLNASVVLVAALVMVSCADIIELLECDPSFGDHVIPSPEYCDRYVVCKQNGIKEIKTCPINENLNIVTSKCAAADKVSCGRRTRLWRQDHLGSDEVFTSSNEESNYHLHGDENLKDNENLSQDNNNVGHHSESEDGQDAEKLRDSHNNDQKITHQKVHDDPLADVECEEDDEDYVVPDPTHCDRYLVCPSTNKGQVRDLLTNPVKLCEEGEALDTETGYCGPRETTDCGTRHLNFRDNLREVEARLEAKVQGILRNLN